MPETRYIEVYDSDGNLVAREPYEISDAELTQEILDAHFNDIHTAALSLYADWDTVTLQQKDRILRELLGFILWKEGWLTPEEE